MLGPLISIIAGAIQENAKEQEARQQKISEMYMSRARELNPKMSMAPYESAMFNREMESRRGQMISQMLSQALQGYAGGAEKPNLSKTRDAPTTNLSQPSLLSGDYGTGYGYGAPSSFQAPGSDYQLPKPLLLR